VTTSDFMFKSVFWWVFFKKSHWQPWIWHLFTSN